MSFASPPRPSSSRRSEDRNTKDGEAEQNQDQGHLTSPLSSPSSSIAIETLLTSPEPESQPKLPASTTSKLYISHLLSTWNTRVFEFGAILFLANIFPGDLFYLSLYALVRGGAAVLFAPLVGRYIDFGERLGVVRVSIVGQRIVVVISCGIFWVLVRKGGSSLWLWLMGLILLACVEKVCSIMNFVAVEKDWVVVIAGGDESILRGLNSQMRRIDLICKLAGPFAIALLDGISTELAIIVTLAMNLGSVLFEYFAIARVYHKIPVLQIPKETDSQGTALTNTSESRFEQVRSSLKTIIGQLKLYLTHSAFLPSFACTLLYFTVLSFSGQMITYLLSIGFTSIHIGIARTISVFFEISATWLAPLLMQRIGPVRSGMWFINWQISCLMIGTGVFFWGFKDEGVWYPAFALMAGMMLSRVGLWGFDLSVQVIIQEEVEATNRGSFSAIEASWQNVFELCSYGTTLFFSRPENFQWPVLMSCAAVLTAAALYAGFVRRRRGHLLHWSRCLDPGEIKRRRGGYEALVSPSGVRGRGRGRGLDV